MPLSKQISISIAALSMLLPMGKAIALDDALLNLENYAEFGGQTTVEVNPLGQINNVFQLGDVEPSAWAFDALRNLVEKYNCIVGYPDSTYRGDRPLSRYEFAAGLNACMQQIEKMVIGGEDVDGADIVRLRSLVQEFEEELATLGARVDDLEGRVEVPKTINFLRRPNSMVKLFLAYRVVMKVTLIS